MRVGWKSVVVLSLAVTAPAGRRHGAGADRGDREGREEGVRPGRRGRLGRGTEGEAPPVERDDHDEGEVLRPPRGGRPGRRNVEFPNQDPVFHNVFSVSGENRFDLDLYKKPKSGAWVFRHPGLVRVYCNIHPQMSAYVLVRDNPFWARPSEDGGFEIPDVPAGTWVVKAWHERAGEASQAVTVTEEGALDVALTLDASKWKRAPHKNKFGKDYEAGEKY